MNTIQILVSDDDNLERGADEPVLGTLSGDRRDFLGNTVGIGADKLKNSVTELTAQLTEIFREIKTVGDFSLKEVTVSVQINAEGKVILIGKAGITGGITLKFSP